jgi:hypothetical protein
MICNGVLSKNQLIIIIIIKQYMQPFYIACLCSCIWPYGPSQRSLPTFSMGNVKYTVHNQKRKSWLWEMGVKRTRARGILKIYNNNNNQVEI